MNERRLVKVSTYAKLKGVTRQAVYYLINTGALPVQKIDGQYFVIVNR